MGWANCGTDRKGRPIGYAHEATCDHPGCAAKIHRGIAYACGDMHGDDTFSCEGYFCDKHRTAIRPAGEDRIIAVCLECAAAWRAAEPEAAEAFDEE
jgi:hypothetical protein